MRNALIYIKKYIQEFIKKHLDLDRVDYLLIQPFFRHIIIYFLLELFPILG
jgi:hypothetical protein